MRIIAGQHRGRPLIAPRGQDTRPTADRTRETLFSMLVSRIGDLGELWVADLFAGSGALGLEALSRGAARAVFVENDRAALDAIRQNIAALGYEARSEVRPQSAKILTTPVKRGFDIVFADPPYEPGSGDAVVEAIDAANWLLPGGWLAIETDAKEEVAPGPMKLEVSRKVGRSRVTLLSRAPKS
ncbi:MAG: 16S rRNA (guanine(966)-N(2))-methyltransferase RsmD [Sphingomonas sp.]|nr:16S rRNA (guanine(966)-N(2))-methyltransferase RsmD [Sphingomonas sp.]RZV49298.1 MAG: 16S rRNA (guanine(966)-N(2))-methyltransferase RsmD [Sphingomonadaceae bacterium]